MGPRVGPAKTGLCTRSRRCTMIRMSARLAAIALCTSFVVVGSSFRSSLAQAPAGGTVALTGARVINGTGAAALDKAAILIANGRIEAVGTEAAVKIPAGRDACRHVRQDNRSRAHQRTRSLECRSVRTADPRQAGRAAPRVRRLRHHHGGRPRDRAERSGRRGQAARCTRERDARSRPPICRWPEPQGSQDGGGSPGGRGSLRGREGRHRQVPHHRRPQ